MAITLDSGCQARWSILEPRSWCRTSSGELLAAPARLFEPRDNPKRLGVCTPHASTITSSGGERDSESKLLFPFS